MKIISQHRGLVAFAVAGLAVSAAQAEPRSSQPEWGWAPQARVVEAVPPLPPPSTYPIQLVLDDDTSDGAFGVSGQTARQFLWFNRFSPAAGFHLEEVWVLFPSGTNMAAGGAVQIAIYEDPDGDPTNGAALVASFDTTIQAADGNTFSIYPVPGSPTIPTGSDLLVGVVPRFVESGVTSPTLPAALDTAATQGRSWLAVWTNDPPDPPVLSPLPDQTLTLVDALVPNGGNWMIRAFGTVQTVTEIPTLGAAGLAALALAILAAGFLALARRRRASALALLLLASAVPASAVTIDSFTINQATLTDPPGGSSIASDASADPIGQHRGLVIKNLAGAGPSSVGVAGGNLTLTVTATTPDSRGEARLSWDGDTNALVLSPTGLANTNLTVGNASGFRLNFASTTVVAEVEITVYDDAANFSRAARRVPVSGSPQDVLIPFAEFRVAAGTGAAFASVGAIELTLRSGEGTVVLNEITTTAPTVGATKVDSQILDADGDGRLDPGDRVRYTVTVTNTGNEALAVDLSDTVDANTTLVAGSVSSTPVAHNDQYGWFGNVNFASDGSAAKPNLLDNDQDADGDTLTVQAGTFPATSVLGGALTLVSAATGAFTYSPPPGVAGVDSFDYTVVDDDGHTSAATAYLDLRGVVWFVDDSNTTPPFLGTLADPFQSLAAVNGAGDADQPGDTIFVFDDDGTPYAGGLVLEADQTLLGEGAGLILDGTTVVPAGGRPQITNAAGIGLTLATNNTLGGFDIQSTSGAGIFGSAFGTLAATNVNVLTTGGAALDLTNGTLSSVAFGTLSSTGAGGQRGLNLATLTGSLTATTTSLTNPTTDGILVSGSAGASFSFGTTTVTDNAIGSGATADGVDVATGNAGATFNFASLALTTDAGTGLRANSSGTINIVGASNTITSTTGPAVDIVSTSLGAGATFATLSSTNSPGKGINLDTISGALTANGGAVSGAGANCFDINGGAGNITYAGSISCTASRVVEVTGRTGGTVTLSGALTANGSATGINVASNTGGTVNFSGSSKSLSTTTGAAVTLATNTGATIDFTGGGLAITTTSGAGFNATGGAAAITVQGSNNTITSTTGTALNVANSAIGLAGLSFRSISANGGANGIVLSNTCGGSVCSGAAGFGGLTVNGDGSNMTAGGNGSGGTLANMTGADLATTGTAVYLNNTRDVVLRRVNITGANQNYGLRGYAVHNFTLEYSTVGAPNPTNAASVAANPQGTAVTLAPPENAGEGSIYFGNDAAGQIGLTGTGTITNCFISAGRADNMRLTNSGGTLNRLNISGTTFGLNSAALPIANAALTVVGRRPASGTTTLNSTVSNCTFSGSPANAANFTGQEPTTTLGVAMDTVFTGNTITNNHANNIIGGSSLTIAGFSNTTFNVSGNSMRDANGSAITLQLGAPTSGSAVATSLVGRVANNIIGQLGSVGSGSATANGIFFSFADNATLPKGQVTLAVTNNQIYGYSGNAAIYADNTGGSYDLDLTLTGNSSGTPGAGAFAGLALTAGAPTSADDIDVCAQIGGAGALQNDFSTGDPTNANDIILGVSTGASSMRLPGYGGSTLANVQTFVLGNNNFAGTVVTAYVDAPATATNFTGGAACQTPP